MLLKEHKGGFSLPGQRYDQKNHYIDKTDARIGWNSMVTQQKETCKQFRKNTNNTNDLAHEERLKEMRLPTVEERRENEIKYNIQIDELSCRIKVPKIDYWIERRKVDMWEDAR